MKDVSNIDLQRAKQVLLKYNTSAVMRDGYWDIRGGLVDVCCYARLSADASNRFCLSTAALAWQSNDIPEMIYAVTEINKCLSELREINENLVRN
jgi:hypothetical protein